MNALISFIVPLRAPETCQSWSTVSALCNRTIESIVNQTHADWRCFLICNERPKGFKQHPQVRVTEWDYPIPANIDEQMLDKGRKKYRALCQIREQPTPYVMLVDADDLIHSELVHTVSTYPSASGWFMQNGYFYYEKDWPFLIRSSDFETMCGTSIIARVEPDELPMGSDEWLESPFSGQSHFLMKPHESIRGHLSAQGIEMKAFPFSAVIAVRGTNENVVWATFPYRKLRSKFGILRRSRPITSRIRRNYCI